MNPKKIPVEEETEEKQIEIPKPLTEDDDDDDPESLLSKDAWFTYFCLLCTHLS